MRYFNQMIITIFLIVNVLHAQMIHRYGTTTGNFLEIGVDSEGSAMEMLLLQCLMIYLLFIGILQGLQV